MLWANRVGRYWQCRDYLLYSCNSCYYHWLLRYKHLTNTDSLFSILLSIIMIYNLRHSVNVDFKIYPVMNIINRAQSSPNAQEVFFGKNRVIGSVVICFSQANGKEHNFYDWYWCIWYFVHCAVTILLLTHY